MNRIKKMSPLFLLTLTLFLIAGCTSTETPTNNETMAESDIREIIPATVNVQAALKNMEVMSNFDSYHLFDFLSVFDTYWGRTEADYAWHDYYHVGWRDGGIVVWADITMRDVYALIVGYDDDDTGFIPYIAHEVFVADEILPDTPLVFSPFFTIGGIMPREGFSFVDTDYVKRYFYIFFSGKDGTVLLGEFNIEVN